MNPTEYIYFDIMKVICKTISAECWVEFNTVKTYTWIEVKHDFSHSYSPDGQWGPKLPCNNTSFAKLQTTNVIHCNTSACDN